MLSLVIGALLYFGSASPIIAQERSGFGTEEGLKNQDELSPHMDSHVNSTTPSGNASTISSPSSNKDKEHVRDTVSNKVPGAVRNKPDTTQKKAEEETLSYNILYFIIQKFKVPEIMN